MHVGRAAACCVCYPPRRCAGPHPNPSSQLRAWLLATPRTPAHGVPLGSAPPSSLHLHAMPVDVGGDTLTVRVWSPGVRPPSLGGQHPSAAPLRPSPSLSIHHSIVGRLRAVFLWLCRSVFVEISCPPPVWRSRPARRALVRGDWDIEPRAASRHNAVDSVLGARAARLEVGPMRCHATFSL